MLRSKKALIKNASSLHKKINKLLIKSKNIASASSHGVHGLKNSGQGEEFWQFRSYQYGDSSSLIDWRKTASSQNIFIREKERQVSDSFFIGWDNSKSMTYSSNKNIMSKIDYSNLLLLSLSQLLINEGEKVCIIENDNKTFNSYSNINKIAEIMIKEKATFTFPNLNNMKNKSKFIFTSDFFFNLNNLESMMEIVKKKKAYGVLIQLLDPCEVTLANKGRVIYNSLEESKSITIDNVEEAKKEYEFNLKNHNNSIKAIALKAGCKLLSFNTSEPIEKNFIKLCTLLSRGSEFA